MLALIDQQASALSRPAAAPRGTLVITRRPVPIVSDPERTGQTSKTAIADHSVSLKPDGQHPQIKHDRKSRPNAVFRDGRLPVCVNQLPRFHRADPQRLLHQYMQSILKSPNPKCHMRPVGRGDQNSVKLSGMREHLIRIFIPLYFRISSLYLLLAFLIPAADTGKRKSFYPAVRHQLGILSPHSAISH